MGDPRNYVFNTNNLLLDDLGVPPFWHTPNIGSKNDISLIDEWESWVANFISGGDEEHVAWGCCHHQEVYSLVITKHCTEKIPC